MMIILLTLLSLLVIPIGEQRDSFNCDFNEQYVIGFPITFKCNPTDFRDRFIIELIHEDNIFWSNAIRDISDYKIYTYVDDPQYIERKGFPIGEITISITGLKNQDEGIPDPFVQYYYTKLVNQENFKNECEIKGETYYRGECLITTISDEVLLHNYIMPSILITGLVTGSSLFGYTLYKRKKNESSPNATKEMQK